MSSARELPPEIADISMEALRQDDSAEWEKAYPLLWPAAEAGARSNPYPFSDHDIEDFATEAILQVRVKLIARAICHPDGEFRELLGIVYVTAYRRSVEEFRKRVRRKTDSTGDTIEPKSSQPYAQIPVSHTLPSLEDILFALKELPPPQPEIFLAVRLHERSPDEVAKAYGKSYANVNQIVCRVTKWLRDWFKGEGGASA